MEEGYLALRWNNHNTIFTKLLTLLREQEAYVDVSLACAGRLYPAHKFVLSTCSDYFKEMFSKNPCKHPIVFMKDVSTKDMEALLDFMYKGEVHVPQSELGSLLRTAEGLQVKGLAVPDDSPRVSSSSLSSTTPVVPSTPSVPRSHPPTLMAPSHLRANKRKRPAESSRKDDPPKLTPRPDLGSQTQKFANRQRSRPSTMPELKRIKREPATGTGENMEPGEVPHSPSPVPSSHNSEDPQLNHASKIKVEHPDLEKEEEGYPEEDEGVAGEGMSGEEEHEEEEEDEEEEEEEDDKEGILSHGLFSDVDACEQSNSSLPNSDMSTTELLQVDLSEDGTQFIIGPGGFGEAMSRASSLAGDEERDGDREQKKPFVCPLCGQSFTRRDNLANHIKTHTGDRPFMCQYCHKCFSRKDYLKQHERIHTGEKPYACDICGRAFTRKEGLTDHMRCHSDFKAFSCETCGKSFKQKCGLRFHKRNYKH
ncbi:GDNF-inducible zinc finger protein 1-like [Portunus trituberculatus]|uniref:Protein bric-a-brac 1 n=1 Tax=Portunus trituberculatus TaxID=210409 RepID=A0A5B7E7K2_PORTR|nr:GDNF-inducible zinc finger protein 1-like [Portunus trituberculatus]XP_045117810.1 GDNF-inducible zinc finger protein 1-like [Portunus trituberculatus]XP_045117811.1 GDNF-inducible zinc finger protein 1-like [Portunus trituberculatus]XP_045117812.1 GDNF-inducible zinc finger protein 1-like [Portunus trituberculatus]XP_045117813.1 GDNF-inducible zinc finger protein 1-like [Portunus trituberculatus]MPC29176.1 Protein bric-a-brac 1 [Portunus trituberculatus]